MFPNLSAALWKFLFQYTRALEARPDFPISEGEALGQSLASQGPELIVKLSELEN